MSEEISNVVNISDTQEVVENAQLEGESVSVDRNGNVILGASPEQVTRMGGRNPTKLELKRAQIFKERVSRLMNKNPGMSQEEAFKTIQKEDHENLPIPKRLSKIENVIAQSMNNLAQEIQGLHHNDSTIAEAFDVNYRALGMMFEWLGINKEKQKEFVEKAIQEVKEAKEAAQKAQQAAQEATEEKAIVEGAKAVSTEAAPIPEGATVFGG
jgi:hypothetical protein